MFFLILAENSPDEKERCFVNKWSNSLKLTWYPLNQTEYCTKHSNRCQQDLLKFLKADHGTQKLRSNLFVVYLFLEIFQGQTHLYS